MKNFGIFKIIVLFTLFVLYSCNQKTGSSQNITLEKKSEKTIAGIWIMKDFYHILKQTKSLKLTYEKLAENQKINNCMISFQVKGNKKYLSLSNMYNHEEILLPGFNPEDVENRLEQYFDFINDTVLEFSYSQNDTARDQYVRIYTGEDVTAYNIEKSIRKLFFPDYFIDKSGNNILNSNEDYMIFEGKKYKFSLQFLLLPLRYSDRDFLVCKDKEGNMVKFTYRITNDSLILYNVKVSEDNLNQNIVSAKPVISFPLN